MKIDVRKKFRLKKRCWSDCSIPENQALWKVEKKGSVPLSICVSPLTLRPERIQNLHFFIPDQSVTWPGYCNLIRGKTKLLYLKSPFKNVTAAEFTSYLPLLVHSFRSMFYFIHSSHRFPLVLKPTALSMWTYHSPTPPKPFRLDYWPLSKTCRHPNKRDQSNHQHRWTQERIPNPVRRAWADACCS